MIKNNLFYDFLFTLYLLFYAIIHLLFMEDFPHFNEAEIAPGRLLLLVQQWAVFRFESLFTMRLLSFGCSLLLLALLYIMTVYILKFRICGLLCTVLFSLNITFITAAHYDLTIMICLLFAILLLFYNIAHFQKLLHGHVILTGLVIGALSLFSLYFLLIFVGFFSLYVFYMIRTSRGFRFLADYLLAFGVSSFIFLVLKLGLTFAIPSRLAIPYQGNSASISLVLLFPELSFLKSPTVYMPPYQFTAFLCVVCLIFGLYLVLKERNLTIRYSFTALLYPLLGFAIVFLFMRELDPFGILFLMLPAYMIFPYVLINAPKRMILPTVFILISINLAISISAVLPFTKDSYSDYLSHIKDLTSVDDAMLVPYNALFASPGHVVFYRDIPETASYATGFRRFIKENDITCILYPEDIQLIHAAAPHYEQLYGGMSYFTSLHNFLENNCTEIGTFESPYGMNIAKYYWQKKWRVKVYQVRADDR